MNDLSIRVSATDMASNVLAAVGDNVKTLGSVATSAFDKMASSGRDVANAAASASSSSTMIVAGTGPLGLLAGTIGMIGGSAIAAAGAIAGIGVAAILAADKSRRELEKVTTTLSLIEAQRINIPVTMIGAEVLDSFAAKIKRVSEQLELATTIKSSKFVDLANSALLKGFDVQGMDQTLKAASALSFAFGTSLEGGLAKVRSAADGTFDSFENLIPGINEMATSEEKLAAVSKLASDALTLQVQSTDTVSGALSRVSNGMGNFLERLGSGVSVTELFAGTLAEIVFPVVDLFGGKILGLGDRTEWLKNTIHTSFAQIAASIEVYTNRGSLSFELMKLKTLYLVEQISIGAEMSFTKVIPAYVDYFVDYIGAKLYNAGSYIKHFVESSDTVKLWKSINSFDPNLDLNDLKVINEKIWTNAPQNNFKVTPTLPSLKDIFTSREITTLETQLGSMIDKLGVGAADEFKTAFEKAFDALEIKVREFEERDTKINITPQFKVPPVPELQASQANLNQGVLESRVMARGPLDTPLDKIQKSVDELVKLSQRNVQISEEQLRSEKVANAFGASNSGFGNAFADIEIEMSN